MANPTDDELVGEMRTIISASDLDQLTFKTILTVLSAKYGDLSEKKDFLKGKLTEIMTEGDEQQDDNTSDNGNHAEETQPPADENSSDTNHADVEEAGGGDEQEGEEEGGGGDEANHEAKAEDDVVGDLSKENLEVQKLLLESYKYGTRSTRSTRAPPKKAWGSSKRKAKSSEDDGANNGGENSEGSPEKKKKKTSSRPKVNKPKILSPGLAAALGESELTRPEVVKRLHTYIKEHCQKDPRDGRKILLDDVLQQVFKKKTTNYFQMNTLLSKHLTDPGELV